jgi:NADPH-dependent 2,4-dienoyl-CoA reductase/sulfur reductase-like enzyme
MISDLYKNIFVIGGNASGLAAASQARRVNSDLNITVLESGNYISYGSCGLPYFISGIVQNIEDLFTYTKDFFEEKRKIKILLNHRVVSINPGRKEITAITELNDNSSNSYKNIVFNYDRLIICSGASPVKFEIPGINSVNVFYFRNIEDTINIKNFIIHNSPKKASIIGGGSIGLLIAEALNKLGIKVTVIESEDKIFNDYENEITDTLNNTLKKSGIEIIPKSTVDLIIFNKSTNMCYALNASTKVGSTMERFDLETDLVIIAAGIIPNTDFLKGSFIDTGQKNAIKVSPKQQTSQSNIYAAGDCCLVKNIITKRHDYIPTASNAIKTGRIAGANAAGSNEEFAGSAGTKVDRILGLEIAKTGIGFNEALEYRFNAIKITDSYPSHIKAIPGSQDITITLIIDKSSRKLLGAQMIGKEGVAKRIDIFATALASGMTVDDIYMLDLSYAPSISTAPDAVNKICGKAAIMLNKLKF